MRWIPRLKSTFGAPFLILIISIYWSQGFRSLAWVGISYQLKDELKLSPSASQLLISTAFFPWSVKPLYGILSDCIPIGGSRRISYLIISSLLSFVPWLLLGSIQSMRASYMYLAVLLMGQNFGAAMADVVIDAMVADAARKERAEFAGDLQSMSWFAMALGGMVGSVASGFVLSTLSLGSIFLLFSGFPLLQLVTCGLIDERGLSDGTREEDMGNIEKNDGEASEDTKETEVEVEPIKELRVPVKEEWIDYKERHTEKDTGFVARNIGKDEGDAESPVGGPIKEKGTEEEDDWVEIEESSIEEMTEDCHLSVEKKSAKAELSTPEEKYYEQLVILQEDGIRKRREIFAREDDCENAGEVQELSKESFGHKLQLTFRILFQAIKQPAILRPMLWFFLAQMTIPSLSTIMFYYQTNFLRLDASFLGTSRLVDWGALMLGMYLYNCYFKQVQLRRILWWVHIALTFITLLDIILVSGINIWLGIPDRAFVMGVSALGEAVNQFKIMPFLVLSGRFCQPGIEGNLFALFMSLSNLGSTVSSFLGAIMAYSLQISSDKFDNLALGIYVQAVCTPLPIFFLYLVPSDVTGVLANSSD